jgi:hypothetical protein
MISDAVRWLERDLREVVRSYFQPLRLIGKDINAAMTKNDRAINASAAVSYTEMPDDDTDTQRRHPYRSIVFRIRLPTAFFVVGISVILLIIVPMVLGSAHGISVSSLQYKILMISLGAVATAYIWILIALAAHFIFGEGGKISGNVDAQKNSRNRDAPRQRGVDDPMP